MGCGGVGREVHTAPVHYCRTSCTGMCGLGPGRVVEAMVGRSTPLLFTIVGPAARKQANRWYLSEGEQRGLVLEFESYTGSCD